MQFGRLGIYPSLAILFGEFCITPPNSFEPGQLSGLQAWYNADSMQTAPSIPGAQAGFVPRLGDDSGLAREVVTGANANSPIYNSSQRALEFFTPGQNSYLTRLVAYASEWTFMSNGTGATAVAVVKPSASSTGSNCTVFNNTGSTSSRGVWLYYDGVNQRFSVILRNDTVQIALIQGPINSCPRDQWYTVVYTYQEGLNPEVRIFVNGTLHASGNTTAAPSINPPAFVGMTLGRLGAAGLHWLNGYLRTAYFYNRVLNEAEIATVSSKSLTLTSPRPIRRIWTVGDSLTVQDQYQHQMFLRHLATPNMQIDFVGSKLAGEIALFVDRQHDGYTAHTIQTIMAATNGLNINATPTDVIVMAGTNNAGQDMATTQNAYNALIQQTIAQRPGARIWCMAPPRRIDTPANETWMNTYRAFVQTYANTNGYQYINGDVDNNSEMQMDGVHPTVAGYHVIGNKAYDAFVAAL